MNADQENYMRRCIELAQLGAGATGSNPMVGSVLVHENRIIGEGYHQVYGGPHAEVNCINAVSAADQPLISGSTIYVSLEPCAHYGKTPPCADLIIAKGIKKVVIGCRDPFPEVDGKGIEKLKAAGVEVQTGILEAECRYLNRRFFTFHELRRPYIILKWAETADGFIGSRTERLIISNSLSQRLVHKWRSEEMSIMVGTNTALNDDPQLTARHWSGRDPIRIILDRTLRLPDTLIIFKDGVPTIILNSEEERISKNIRYVLVDQPEETQVSNGFKHNEGNQLIDLLIAAIARQNITSVLVEGGQQLLQLFIDAGYWDEARIIKNRSKFIGHGIAAPVLTAAQLINSHFLQNDELLYLHNPLNSYLNTTGN